MDDVKDFEKLLSDPFEPADVEWRAQASGMRANITPWIRVIPYINSRAVQQRLDDVFGIWGWENAFKEAGQSTVIVKEWINDKPVKVEKLVNNWLCGITIINGDKRVTKWDGASETAIDPFKGGLSGSEKRAAVQMGIGRYLYHFKAKYITGEVIESRYDMPEGGNLIEIRLDIKKTDSAKIPYVWFPPEMPDWAMPNVEADMLINKINIATDVIALEVAYDGAYNYAKSFSRSDLIDKIVEAKDNRKEQLNIKSGEEDNKITNKIVAWLERIILDEITSADNESVLKLAKRRISKDLDAKVIKEGLDFAAFFNILEKRYQEKLNELTRR